jgi:DNA-binding CsgD family transcriptional regulator
VPESGKSSSGRGNAAAPPAHDGGLAARIGLSALLVAIAGGGAIDLALDRPHTPGAFHLVFETALLVLSLGSVAWLWLRWLRTRRALARVRDELEGRRAERDAWRARAEKLLRGLGEAIDAQLRGWSLTPAERETALFLLKGYGHKEIATLLGKSERTVRQHAVAVYRKSGLGGRAELSAFFLEDLLLPAGPEPDRGGVARVTEVPHR